MVDSRRNLQAVITVDGATYPTVADAARALGVSTKAVNDYIKRGIIPPPPTVVYGLRDVNIYPEDFMVIVRQKIKDHRDRAKRSRSARGATDG